MLEQNMKNNIIQGSEVPEIPKPSGTKFGGFKPEAEKRIAQSLGYMGNMANFNQFLEENPDKKEQMDKYTSTAMKMEEGGAVQQADPRVLSQQFIPQQPSFAGQDITQVQA